MNRQEARAIALRNCADTITSGYRVALWTDHTEEEEDKINKERQDIAHELHQRASRIETNLTLKPKRSKKQ